MGKAFLIASDKSQEDLRTNLFLRLHEVTKLKIISVSIEDNSTWFAKPSLILDALKENEQVCWLDCDIEVLQNFDDIFNIPSKGIAAVPDYLYPFSLNTGVVVVDKREYGIMTLWSAMCNMRATRGDQESLDALRKHYPESFEELPKIYNHQRLAIPTNPITEETRIIHWTGPTGKAILRNKLAQ